MGEPISRKKGKLAGNGKHNARLVDEIKRGEEKKEREQKECTSRVECTIQVMVDARQGNIKMVVSEDHASCWVHRDLTVKTKKSGFVDSSEGVGRKGRISNMTDRYGAGILDGHRDRQIRMLRIDPIPRHSNSR